MLNEVALAFTKLMELTSSLGFEQCLAFPHSSEHLSEKPLVDLLIT